MYIQWGETNIRTLEKLYYNVRKTLYGNEPRYILCMEIQTTEKL